MTLHQHLGNTGRTTEVSVDLERRMRIEKIGICTSVLAFFIGRRTYLFGNQLISVVTIEQPRPETNFPTHRPAGRMVAATVKRFLGSLHQHRRIIGDLPTRIESPQMGNVAMAIPGVVPVFEPLLQLSPTPDLHRSQLRGYRTQAVDKNRLLAHHRSGIDGIGEKIVDHLVVHRRTSNDHKRAFAVDRRCIFGRIRGRYHQPIVFGFAHKEIDIELARAFHQRIYFTQIFFIAREQITIPQMLAEPCIAGRPHAVAMPIDRTGRCPNIGIMV